MAASLCEPLTLEEKQALAATIQVRGGCLGGRGVGGCVPEPNEGVGCKAHDAGRGGATVESR